MCPTAPARCCHRARLSEVGRTTGEGGVRCALLTDKSRRGTQLAVIIPASVTPTTVPIGSLEALALSGNASYLHSLLCHLSHNSNKTLGIVSIKIMGGTKVGIDVSTL